LIYSYINTRGNWENSKLCENTPPFGRRVSTQFLVFPISTRADITVYQHGKCFIFVKYTPFIIQARGYHENNQVLFKRLCCRLIRGNGRCIRSDNRKSRGDLSRSFLRDEFSAKMLDSKTFVKLGFCSIFFTFSQQTHENQGYKSVCMR
jgi:hypothetical protein